MEIDCKVVGILTLFIGIFGVEGAGLDEDFYLNLDALSGGWTSKGGIGTLLESPSPARNQLSIWERNRTAVDLYSRATNLHGNPYPSLTASQAIGTRGHLLFQDYFLIDKLSAFFREKVVERIVHAKGAGAHGYFVVTQDISKYTKADFLTGIGKRTRTFTRFSTSAGETGSADTQVDPHGFATKFFTQDGNHDLLMNSIEAFPVRDPLLFADQNRSRKRNPVTNLRDMNMWWDFASLRPETTLHMLHLHSDIGRPDGYRRQDGYAIHAFKLVNAKGDVIFAKFKWESLQPAPALTWQRAAELTGINPEYNTQDLYDAIARGDYPQWNLTIQVMTVEQAKNHPVNPFDITKPWNTDSYPWMPVGKLTLNRNPSNYFAEVEQAGFQVSNMVPGIQPSPDPMLSARLFAYQDSQRYRLGVNGPQLPINRPIVPVTSYNRNGRACHGDNGGGSPNYYPNSFGGVGLGPDPDYAEQVSFAVKGVVDRYDIPEDEHEEPRRFLERRVDPAHRIRLVDAIAVRLMLARKEIREQALKNMFYPISKEFGDEVREAVERHLSANNK